MLDITTKEGYDLATALRGPDQDYPKLKYIVTGWIRGKLNLVTTVCQAITVYQVRHGELTPHDVDMAKEEVKHLFACPHQHGAMLHWASHATQAIRWLRPSLTSPVGRRERELTHELIGMLRHSTKRNKARVLGCLDNWLEPKLQVYDVGNTHRRRRVR